MKILALDTATALCGVAVLDLDGERAAVRLQRVTTHSEMLLPLAAECLTELALRPSDLSGVACGAGPGSFTGLRIGLATAKGLCFALELPLAMVSSLEALAARGQKASPGQPVLAVLDGFRGQVFARLVLPPGSRAPAVEAAVSRAPQLLIDAVYAPEALAAAVVGVDFVLVGHKGPWGRQRCDDELSPHPLDVARLGAAKLRAGEAAALRSVVPNYLCLSAAEEAWKARQAS